jgi:hypothetical protein
MKGFNQGRNNIATLLLIELDDFLTDGCDVYSESSQLKDGALEQNDVLEPVIPNFSYTFW